MSEEYGEMDTGLAEGTEAKGDLQLGASEEQSPSGIGPRADSVQRIH